MSKARVPLGELFARSMNFLLFLYFELCYPDLKTIARFTAKICFVRIMRTLEHRLKVRYVLGKERVRDILRCMIWKHWKWKSLPWSSLHCNIYEISITLFKCLNIRKFYSKSYYSNCFHKNILLFSKKSQFQKVELRHASGEFKTNFFE